jgi:PIN domain nuclease of toxin-antitoxin system
MFLLDTYVFLWALAEPKRLSVNARTILSRADLDIFVSMASLWELTIQQQHSRIISTASFASEVDRLGFHLLDITIPHLVAVKNLPLLHQDAFDHMLIAQAKLEGLTLITDNKKLQDYGISVLAG